METETKTKRRVFVRMDSDLCNQGEVLEDEHYDIFIHFAAHIPGADVAAQLRAMADYIEASGLVVQMGALMMVDHNDKHEAGSFKLAYDREARKSEA
jgi:hypothetical protein